MKINHSISGNNSDKCNGILADEYNAINNSKNIFYVDHKNLAIKLSMPTTRSNTVHQLIFVVTDVRNDQQANTYVNVCLRRLC